MNIKWFKLFKILTKLLVLILVYTLCTVTVDFVITTPVTILQAGVYDGAGL